MSPVTDRSFGLLIAYLLPGFMFLWLWEQEFPAVSSWLAVNPGHAPTVGGFLYITLASIGVGLLLSTLRWAILDQLHHASGLKTPDWSQLQDVAHLDAYRLVIDLHYRYYQFYGSTVLLFTALLASPPHGQFRELFLSPFGQMLLISGMVLFYSASKDSLTKYYTRFVGFSVSQTSLTQRIKPMTNGGQHESIPSTQPTNKQTTTAACDLAPAEKSTQTEISGSKKVKQKSKLGTDEDN